MLDALVPVPSVVVAPGAPRNVPRAFVRVARRLAPALAVSLAALTATSCTSGNGYARGRAFSGAAPLVGGVVDDNVRLPEYLAYVSAYPHDDVPKLDLADRQVFAVLGRGDAPLWDAAVTVPTASGPYVTRTNAAGLAMLPRAALGLASDAPAVAHVYADGMHGTAALPAGASAVRADVARRAVESGVRVDVALVVDTTGSMQDEVESLRATLRAFVARCGAHPLRPRVRIGGVAYRDVGDDYVVRRFDFTDDAAAVERRLAATEAAGGGDGPEAVQEALDEAVNGLSWGGAGTLRVMFLIGDAPPHFERGTPYTVTMRRALERGITIFPIACSGMDDRGEFVWRQLAAVTLGKFLFVSYAGTTDHHTGPYVENDLHTLMQRGVLEQLDALVGAPATLPAPVFSVAPAVPAPSSRADPNATRPAPYAPAYPPAYPPSYAQPYAPAAAPSTWSGDRVGFGRAPWDFSVPGWSPRR